MKVHQKLEWRPLLFQETWCKDLHDLETYIYLLPVTVPVCLLSVTYLFSCTAQSMVGNCNSVNAHQE